MTDSGAEQSLGELLLAEGKLSEDDLQKALQTQGLIGGRLGTILIENSAIRESTLVEALGRQRSTCTVSAAELARIPAAIIKSIPEKLALRCQLVPYRVRGKTLFVASMDPGDALREDEISFLTSYLVRTCIATEVRMRIALRQYYGKRLNQRFLTLARRLLAQAPSSHASADEPMAPGSSAPVGSQANLESTGSRLALSGSPSSMTSTPGMPTAGRPAPGRPAPGRPRPSLPPQIASTPPRAPASTSPSRSPVGSAEGPTAVAEPSVEFIEIDDSDLALLRRPAPGEAQIEGAGPASPVSMPVAPPEVVAGQSDSTSPATESVPTDVDGLFFDLGYDDADASVEERLDRAARALMEAEIRDDIGEVLLEVAGGFFSRRLLLIARRDKIVGWMGLGEGLEEGAVRSLELDSRAPSIFLGLQETASFWLGPLPSLPANLQVVQALGGRMPRDCLALPVTLRSKVVCYLYCDNLDQGVGGAPVAELKRLVGKAGLAFEVYILKNKIRVR